MASIDPIVAFIERWSKAEVSERANYALFLTQLCGILDVPPPEPAGADATQNTYVFERSVTFHHRGGKTSTGRIDLYKRGCFVCECKQYANQAKEPAVLQLGFDEAFTSGKKGKIARGSEAWDKAMIEAQGQAERYARSLPIEEEPPPILLVVDVGHVFELYADFTQKGKAYLPFPDARSHRIRLADLVREEVRARLRTVWLDPASLDPSKVSADVTREVAAFLAELAKSFEISYPPATVASFLSRCLFCMFAEDIDLLPRDSFSRLLESVKEDPGEAVPLLQQLFTEMNGGKYSVVLRQKILHFNGGLFADATVLPLNGTQLGLLVHAAKMDWKHVEPAIFGTLLERALNPAERHKLGAHYTPRAYVERLVLPTIVEPLREEWSAVRIAAVTLANRGDLRGAVKQARAFHHSLCAVRVLDPACGSGNFLYVTLEHLKRLEGEVLQLIESFGENMRLDLGGETVNPHQFLGIEVNPRAASIAELVLWIGYLQWHHRNRGATEWSEPVLQAFGNIECRDAVLAYDREDVARDDSGAARQMWDRKTHKVDPVTGREVPDDKAMLPLRIYVNPRPAIWPQADFIVGNPPFLGNKRMREHLGDGYVETLREAYPELPESADFVMFWWYKASILVLEGRAKRFGFITTNSITQSFNRRVVEMFSVPPASGRIDFAIPDHPWVDSTDGASVRIAMTVGCLGFGTGSLYTVVKELGLADGEVGVTLSEQIGAINPDLSIGADITRAEELRSNTALSNQGVTPLGTGFRLTPDEAQKFISIRSISTEVLKEYAIGRDLVQAFEPKVIIDFYGYTESDARAKHPELFERVLSTVKPERDQKERASYRNKWWIFAEPRSKLRPAIQSLPRYIATCRTSRHRLFTFLKASVLPDAKIVAIGLDGGFHLGVLSSKIHVIWADLSGGWLGVGNDSNYNHSDCFGKFPFPDCTEKQKDSIRKLAEELDAHRIRAQERHGLKLTDIYNVLEMVRAEKPLSAKDRAIHDAALITTLNQLHEELDRAVADAYEWSWPMDGSQVIKNLVALNAARAKEEAKGYIRWLRPEFQVPLLTGEKQSSLGFGEGAAIPTAKLTKSRRPKKEAWPKTLAERAKVIEAALKATEHPVTARQLATEFSRANESEVAEILETLAALGRAHLGDAEGTFVS